MDESKKILNSTWAMNQLNAFAFKFPVLRMIFTPNMFLPRIDHHHKLES